MGRNNIASGGLHVLQQASAVRGPRARKRSGGGCALQLTQRSTGIAVQSLSEWHPNSSQLAVPGGLLYLVHGELCGLSGKV